MAASRKEQKRKNMAVPGEEDDGETTERQKKRKDKEKHKSKEKKRG